MAYAVFSVVFGEQPSAAKWNILGTNDASFADGTGISGPIGTMPYKFSVYKNASNQTITTSAAQTIVYDVESFDTNNNFASNTYTCPVTGYYFFTALHHVTATASLTRTALSLNVNGATTRERAELASASVNSSVNISELLLLTAGDQVQARGQSTGANYVSILGSQFNTFSGFLVSRN